MFVSKVSAKSQYPSEYTAFTSDIPLILLSCPLLASFTICLVFVVCYDLENLQKRSALGGLEHLLGNEKCDLTKQQNHTQRTRYYTVVLYPHSLRVLRIMWATESIPHTVGHGKFHNTLTYIV